MWKVRALLTEELLEETRREKEESLRRFQDVVRERVSQQARLRKQQQLLKSYETVRNHLMTPYSLKKKKKKPDFALLAILNGSENSKCVLTNSQIPTFIKLFM